MNYEGPVQLTKFRHGKKDKKTGFAVIEKMMQDTPPTLVPCHPGRMEKIKRCLHHNRAHIMKDVDIFRMIVQVTPHIVFTPKVEA